MVLIFFYDIDGSGAGFVSQDVLLHLSILIVVLAVVMMVVMLVIFVTYMQKTCDVAEKAILAKKNCGKSA